MWTRLRTGLASWVVILFSAIALAQTHNPPVTEPKEQNLRVAVDLVLLDVSVADKSGHFVKDLQPEHFKIYEDKVEQAISSFSAEESPVTWGLSWIAAAACPT